MALLPLQQPVSSPEPRLVVHNLLPPGRHRFSLVVVDEHGRTSAPDVCEVTVRPRPAPTPASTPGPQP
ncbi:hypothetical protein [Roseateles sp. BYS87W]|uniref:Penicillin-binding C-terminal domain-containing protein n=1 Tax=Pelomonas baiyunensis TaxID=3299026 RepID=A0ABW7GYX9_9BURK